MPKNDILDTARLTRKKIAEFLGCEQRTITEWLKEGFPRRDDKLYNLKPCIAWLVERLRKQAKPTNKADAELEKLLKQNRKMELEIKKMEGETIPRNRVLEMQYQQSQELMNFLTDAYKKNGQLMLKKLGMPVKKLPDFYEVWDEYIREAMQHFVKGGKRID